ncbi:glycosyl hydrolase [Spirochaetia bacterium]|nr:glycosyl hydrolase [Spirochaetia bacterium]
MDIKKILPELSLKEKAELIAGGDFWHTKAVERLNIPAVMMTDGPIGLRKQADKADHLGIGESIVSVCFPAGAALAASFDRDLLAKLGETLGDECQAEDISMLLGPAMNIKRSPLCGRNFEYFSEDPYLTGQLAAAYVKALEKKGVASCAKHFAVNNQEKFRMTSDSVVDERSLHEIYLAGFEMLVREAHPQGIMCSYNKINGVYASENQELLTDILRKQWGFEGFVVTDWGAVKDRVQGLLSGLDLEMPGPGNNAQKIVDAVTSGSLDEAVLDKAVCNVLKFVFASKSSKAENIVFDREKGHAISGKLATECAVLLKNNGNILPLNKKCKAAFIGEFAVNPRYQGGGSSHINAYKVTSAVMAATGIPYEYAEGFKTKESVTNQKLLAEAVELAKGSDVVVVFAGLTDVIESEGYDRKTLALPENQNALIEAVAEVNPKTVVVLHNGSPVAMPWKDKVAAILDMYLGGEDVGAAAIALLYGNANPCGKLAETFPLKLSDNPSFLNFPGENGHVEYREGVFVGYRYYDKKEMDVLFPFGYGLSYTAFEYNDLTLDKTHMTDTETLTVSCKIKNTGEYTGKEIVQVYIRNYGGNIIRPIRELRDFTKVELNPREEKTVEFTLNKRAFAYYEPRIMDWCVESGIYSVEIAASSRDIRLEFPVEVKSTAVIPTTFTRYNTIGQLMSVSAGQQVLEPLLRKVQEGMGNVLTTIGEMGAGNEMMQAMTFEMPLVSFVLFGILTEEQVDGIVKAVNK